MVSLTSIFFGTGGRVLAVLLALTVVTTAVLARRAVGPIDEADRTISEAVVGLVRPSEVSTVATPIAITIAEMIAAVGDELAAGQPIARIDFTEAQRELAQLGLDVERAQRDVIDREHDVRQVRQAVQRLEAGAAEAGAELALAEREAQQIPMRQARDSPERAQVAYEQAVLRARRVEQLTAAGLVSQQDVEESQFALRVAADDLVNAREAAEAASRLRSAQGAQDRARRDLSLAEQRRQFAEGDAGLQQARLALKQAQMRYETARLATADLYIRSPRRGAVIELPAYAGDRLGAGALVARIALLDPIAVDIDMPPLDVHRLHVGDAARVDVPAIGVSRREAHIRSIAPLPGDNGKYTVRLTLSNPIGARLLAGQAAYVTLTQPPTAPGP